MKKGFTILELLVASLLLGMLVTILTMMFNQSSIAWRTGINGEADLRAMRKKMALVEEDADNTFYWERKTLYRQRGLWKDDGTLMTKDEFIQQYSGDRMNGTVANDRKGTATYGVGNVKDPNSFKSYTVNVMSKGPNNDVDDWEAIWSFPDEIQ